MELLCELNSTARPINKLVSHLRAVPRPPDSRSFPNLLRFPELFDDFRSHLIIFQEVIGDGVANPGGPLGWAQLQELVPRLLRKQNKRFISTQHEPSAALKSVILSAVRWRAKVAEVC